MTTKIPLEQRLNAGGVTRREFLGWCATLAGTLGLSATMGPALAAALEGARRPSVIWLSFQECTGCTESLTRSHAPTIEGLILQHLSLDYHHTLQAASGEAAEEARRTAMEENAGRYLLLVEGSISTRDGGVYSTIAGVTNLQLLEETAAGAAAVIAVGNCASYGGLPAADPNPTGAVGVAELVSDKPVLNISGCPPIPAVITGVVAHYLAFGVLPTLDALGRPVAFYGQRIHDRCYRRHYHDKGLFARSFDDVGARAGWCLLLLGCKGPVTYNACATTKWNDGTSFPIEAGHGCLGCSEPAFWDAGGFYKAISTPTKPVGGIAAGAVAAGAALGAAMAVHNRRKRAQAREAHDPLSVDDLEQES